MLITVNILLVIVVTRNALRVTGGDMLTDYPVLYLQNNDKKQFKDCLKISFVYSGSIFRIVLR